MSVAPLGDSAAVITLGEGIDAAMAGRVQAVVGALARNPPPGVVDVVPAFASIAVFFDSVIVGEFEQRRAALEAVVAGAGKNPVSHPRRAVEVPVCYDDEFGPDLDAVARHARRTAADVVGLHSAAEYLVHAIGFLPGFPYLGGLPSELATPRRATPRSRVAAGSVGIGGAQTGIYPFESPGGWNLIGRTPLRLFDPARAQPALLHAGDRVQFQAISRGEFDAIVAGAATASLGAHSALSETVPGIVVARAGMFTTVQDLGRSGHRASGVALSGAVDPFALRLANLLVGNSETAAGLEFTLIGPELKFLHDTTVALGGAEFAGLPRWRPFKVAAGAVLKLGPAVRGCRGYLAVAGGIDVAPVLGSRSTHTRAGFGGFAGRALREGDVLPVPAVRREVGHHWRIDERILPEYSNAPEVRILAGAHTAEFDPTWTTRSHRVSSQSDRMGLRLTGDALARARPGDLVSSPVAPGTVQVPPDGQPIVLLADAQTIGGYPQIAHVASVDLPLVAQARPGDTVRFRLVSPAEAHESFQARERALALLREGLAQKLA